MASSPVQDNALAASAAPAAKALFTAAEKGLVLLVFAYVVASGLIAAAYGQWADFHPAFYVDSALLCTLVYVAGYFFYRLGRIYYIMFFIRPKKLFAYLKDDFRAGPLNLERYIRAAPVFLAMTVLLSTYTSLKAMIPHINPFSWDPFWADADYLIHGGHDPWRLLATVFSYTPVIKAVNVVYNGWLFIKFMVLYWLLFSLKDPRTRMQFFWSYALIWIVEGSLLAILFSSAGPCFYEQVAGSGRFTPLMDYLKGVDPIHPLWAVTTQAMLWDQHARGALEFGAGISAMPSLHVASTFLFMMAGLRSHRFWQIASVLFMVSIFIGSVLLGWHYAVDGYVAIAASWLLWVAAGKIVKRLDYSAS